MADANRKIQALREVLSGDEVHEMNKPRKPRETLRPSTVYMAPEEMRRIRGELGLSLSQMAEMLDTDKVSLREIENDFKNIGPRMARLLMAYDAGYVPPDWPVGYYEGDED